MTQDQANHWNHTIFDSVEQAHCAGRDAAEQSGNLVYLGAEKLTDYEGWVNSFNVWD